MRAAVRVSKRVAALVSCTLVAGALLAPPAQANPATPAAYTAGSSATRVVGQGFDMCIAPTLEVLAAWKASPYRTVNAYTGGINRGCPQQPNLSAQWVTGATQQGWRILPTYVGYQPSCTRSSKIHRYTGTDAAARGESDALDAIATAAPLGIRAGSAIYADIEHYTASDSACATAVRRYVSAWTIRLHASGYLAGVYAHQDSGSLHLSQSYTSTSYARPDAVWMARWDNVESLTGWPTVSDAHWAVHQRIKQYRGDHPETWGGVTLDIDSDLLDAPVATVALPYKVTSTTSLNARSGPSTSAAVVRTHAPGSTLNVLCQVRGQRVGTTSVWDRLANGTYVSDYYMSTPSKTGFSAPLARCTYPGQVTSSTSLNARTGPGTSYAITGSPLPSGSLAWVACQKAGTKVGTTSVWDQLDDGRWVTDYYVSNGSNTTYAANVPRCP